MSESGIFTSVLYDILKEPYDDDIESKERKEYKEKIDKFNNKLDELLKED